MSQPNLTFTQCIAWGLVELPQGVTREAAQERVYMKRRVGQELRATEVRIAPVHAIPTDAALQEYNVMDHSTLVAVHVTYRQACRVAVDCIEGRVPTHPEVGWKCADGRQMLVSQIGDAHLINCIRKIKRSRWRHDLLEHLEAELSARGIRDVPDPEC